MKWLFHLYYDGFRQMTIGRTLWALILIKLFIIFVVLKLFFFPDFLSMKATDGDKAGYVATQLTAPIQSSSDEETTQE